MPERPGIASRLSRVTGGRIAAGSGLAALALAAAALQKGGAATALLVAIAGIVVVGTFAPAVPFLDRLPVLGASRPLSSEFSIDGRPDLRVRLRPHSDSTAALLRVGLLNTQRSDITSAGINVLTPSDLPGREATDHNGVRVARGTWMPATTELDHAGETRPFDYWSESSCRSRRPASTSSESG